MKNLIIVESPTKAKTIKNFLGGDYTIIASKGHIRDLPKTTFGIKIDNGKFDPTYVISKDHTKIVKEIKDLAKKSDQVYIATDEDREGEAIGYHIAVSLDLDPTKLPRIVFHEITKNAIIKSLENPRNIDLKSVNAQQARRILDRIVGYKLSPLLSSKIQKGLSAGRVQSSALKIVVDREREIQVFKPEEYWTIKGLFDKKIVAELYEFDGKKQEKLSIKDEKTAKTIEEIAKKENYKISSIETKERKTSSPPPFMTSTLQQTASTQLGFSPKKTMMVAQNLYEGVLTHIGTSGVITYMRTDSLNLSKEAVESAREMIEQKFGKKYLPKSPKIYATKSKSAQEAHEAIRPTILDFTPELAKNYIGGDELKLYTLIYNRFFASQMEDALFEIQNVFIKGEKVIFKANGRVLKFDGFYKILSDQDKDSILPKLKEEEQLSLKDVETLQHFTEPPARYSEASLIKKLESLGIGRPSTYAPTISILTSRAYVEIEKKALIATEIGIKVTELLEKHFENIVNSDFTSKMEDILDEVAEDKKDWQKVLWEFYEPFEKQISQGKTQIESQKVVEILDEKCPDCGSDLLKRRGRFGEFAACSAYPKCKYTKNLGPAKEKAPAREVEGIVCPDCGGAIVERISRKGKFYGCKNFPKCKFTMTHEPTNQKCDNCGGILCKREYRKKEILECASCKNRVELD